MRLRQIGRVARQSKWIYGNGRSFPYGWFISVPTVPTVPAKVGAVIPTKNCDFG